MINNNDKMPWEDNSTKTVLIVVLVVIVLMNILMTTGLLYSGGNTGGLLDWTRNDEVELPEGGYHVTQYDGSGNVFAELKGTNITLSHVEDGADDAPYLTLKIDEKEWKHDGGTVLLCPSESACVIDNTLQENLKDNVPTLKQIIELHKEKISKKYIIVISSPDGVPLCLLQGDKCSMSTIKLSPRVVKIRADGDATFACKANVDIYQTNLLNIKHP